MTNLKVAAELGFAAIPVQRPRQQVETQLRRAILEGELAEGDRIPSENALAQSFNVSRATIREALRSLSEAGLLAKGHGTTSGMYVQSVDHNALSRIVAERLGAILDLGSVTPAEVSNFRDLLEVPSARLAAQHRSEASLAVLSEIIDQERSTTFDDPAVPEFNARFHSEIANASGNRVLAAFVAALHSTARPLAFVYIDEEFGRVAVGHHIALHHAIRDEDSEAAALAMRNHLDYLREHINAKAGPEALEQQTAARN
ncbi:FCD domain-containing protein [Agrococcus sp. ARC_14]|uniref:FadR/GntR family transcriptional regulator n=1 Tax=Agrococcus sp. ARC_14 TaxID=2919927 RepID=UPI001F05C57C|nr:FCD domain-containing protein [Agrococcus sp. ARC_14]MCH1881401.1 FCD domain-containing protein [Agrococcus sp. ARC_14]